MSEEHDTSSKTPPQGTSPAGISQPAPKIPQESQANPPVLPDADSTAASGAQDLAVTDPGRTGATSSAVTQLQTAPPSQMTASDCARSLSPAECVSETHCTARQDDLHRDFEEQLTLSSHALMSTYEVVLGEVIADLAQALTERDQTIVDLETEGKSFEERCKQIDEEKADFKTRLVGLEAANILLLDRLAALEASAAPPTASMSDSLRDIIKKQQGLGDDISSVRRLYPEELDATSVLDPANSLDEALRRSMEVLKQLENMCSLSLPLLNFMQAFADEYNTVDWRQLAATAIRDELKPLEDRWNRHVDELIKAVEKVKDPLLAPKLAEAAGKKADDLWEAHREHDAEKWQNYIRALVQKAKENKIILDGLQATNASLQATNASLRATNARLDGDLKAKEADVSKFKQDMEAAFASLTQKLEQKQAETLAALKRDHGRKTARRKSKARTKALREWVSGKVHYHEVKFKDLEDTFQQRLDLDPFYTFPGDEKPCPSESETESESESEVEDNNPPPSHSQSGGGRGPRGPDTARSDRAKRRKGRRGRS